jgi:glycosyltransferase involved in cell wall biosynthesis
MDESVKVPQSCILFATADWDEPYWTNKQHCAKSLAELGVQVLYVESVGLRSPKSGSLRDWQRLWNRLHKGLRSFFFGASERAPCIYVLSPLVIPAGHHHPLLKRLNHYLLKWSIWRSTSGRGFKAPLIWTYHPFMLNVLSRDYASTLLYHCVDDLAALPGVDADAFRAAEAQLLERSNIVFVTTRTLVDHCKKNNLNTHFLPNVVDEHHFGRALDRGDIPADVACIPEPRLCYHGVLSDFKIDFQLLLDVASIRPEWSWIFIGEEREGQNSHLVAELAKLPNVYFLGYKPYKILPDYLRAMQVGLLPSLLNEYTRAMFPMKYYEYLAAGIPVASTPIDFTDTQKEGIRIGASAEDFSSAIEFQLRQGRYEHDMVREMIGSNTWRERTRAMLQGLQGKEKGDGRN